MEHSCIVRHFQHFRSLSESDADLLKTLEQDPVKYRKNATVWSEHEEETHFFTLKSGWACAFHNLEDGSRQILDAGYDDAGDSAYHASASAKAGAPGARHSHPTAAGELR